MSKVIGNKQPDTESSIFRVWLLLGFIVSYYLFAIKNLIEIFTGRLFFAQFLYVSWAIFIPVVFVFAFLMNDVLCRNNMWMQYVDEFKSYSRNIHIRINVIICLVFTGSIVSSLLTYTVLLHLYRAGLVF